MKLERGNNTPLISQEKQRGYIATEWVVLTFIMVMVLFGPIPGQEQSIAGLLMSAIRDFYSNMTLLLSLP